MSSPKNGAESEALKALASALAPYILPIVVDEIRRRAANEPNEASRELADLDEVLAAAGYERAG